MHRTPAFLNISRLIYGSLHKMPLLHIIQDNQPEKRAHPLVQKSHYKSLQDGFHDKLRAKINELLLDLLAVL